MKENTTGNPLRNSTFVHDVTSSILFFAPVQALIPLSAFIAARRFNASPILVGSMITGAYFGFIWNLFFSRVSARFDLKQGIVVLMLISAVALTATGLQHTAVLFCLGVLGYLICFGLGSVQYNSIIEYLYSDEGRLRNLSFRYAAVAAAATALSLAFGLISVSSHQIVFFMSAAAALLAAFVFSRIKVRSNAKMITFRASEIFAVFRENRSLRVVATGLGLYGIVGSAMHIPLTYLYASIGLAEDSVGMLAAIRVGATVIASLLVTPRLRQRGGLANFRMAFMTAVASILCFLSAEAAGGAGFLVVAIGNVFFGISVSGFEVSLQMTAIQLAPKGRATLYINALMIVFGVRGLLWPIAVGFAMQFTGSFFMLLLCLLSAGICLALTFFPGEKGVTPAQH